jgi:hypothetical protein
MKLKQAIHGLQKLQKVADKQLEEHEPSFLLDDIVKVELHYACDIVIKIEDKKLESETK